jgi:hypothetical protein
MSLQLNDSHTGAGILILENMELGPRKACRNAPGFPIMALQEYSRVSYSVSHGSLKFSGIYE